MKLSIFLSIGMLLGMFLGTSSLTAGSVFSRDHEVLTLETEHFTIIFPKETQATAEYLQGMAEGLFTEVADKLRLPEPRKFHIPVVITPDSEDLNGYFKPFPGMRIVCYQAPISPNSGFATFADPVKKLFLHELTHALSLTQTDAFWSFMVGVFGDMAFPGKVTVPGNFVEGITVSFESADGLGRANDTPYASILQQSILEDRFFTFIEATGAAGRYPADSYYIYGGWFSRWLQETYGMEKYAQLWKLLGKGNGFGELPFVKGAFQEVYGVKIDQAWKGFRQWMALKQPVRTDVLPVNGELTRNLATTSHDGIVYWADYRGLWMLQNGAVRFLVAAKANTSHLAVSPDGSKLLVSTTVSREEMSFVHLREFDLKKGQFSDRSFPDHLYEASYTQDGLLACRINGYTQDLVAVGADGTMTVLFKGTERLIPSVPTLMDDGRVLFLLQREGKNGLAFLNPVDLSVSMVECGLNGIRGVFSDGMKVWFSWDNDHSLFKLGVLEKDRVTTYPSLSGGVQFPVGAGNDVYYAGYFAQGERLMKFPDLPADTKSITLKAADPSDLSRPNVYERQATQKAKPFNPFLAALVPQTRFPILRFNDGTSDKPVRGLGFGTVSSDPTESVGIQSSAAWLWYDSFADLSLDLALHNGPVDVTVGAFDRLTSVTDAVSRRTVGTRLLLSDSIEFDLGQLGWNLETGWILSGKGTSYTSPYAWNLDANVLPFFAGATYADLRRSTWEGEADGYSLTTSWTGVQSLDRPDLPPGVVQEQLNFYLPFLNFHSGVTGLAATSNALLLGTSGPVLASGQDWLGGTPYSVSRVYGDRSDLKGPWMAKGQMDIGWAIPVGRDLPFDFYAHSFDLQAGYQGVFLDGTYLDNVYAIMALDYRVGAGLFTKIPLGVGLRIDQALYGAAASKGPRLSLYMDSALY